ncbi:hypothetical protein Fcan01_20031 [Folsomia candida]|uniref:FHA domain-containing protein n=2 Tax=Folsomia candida TaxID=158441 RepID=A0A226DK23_FOLCA|nr:hypothetical protein Fcan01_20031 [Folsomia candida]
MEEELLYIKHETCHGALLSLGRTRATSGCGAWACLCSSIEWEQDAVILNNAGQKCTIGSGQNLNSFNPEKHGEFLTFPNKADIADQHFQIECDPYGSFCLRRFGWQNIFLNGYLIQNYPVELEFGDIFYFSPIFPQCWDSFLIPIVKNKDWKRLLYRKNRAGKEYVVFKFARLGLGHRVKRKLDFYNQSSPTYPAIFENHVILTNIFEHVVNTKISWKQADLLSCRLVSKTWNDSARLVLQKNFVMKFRIITDGLITNPNYLWKKFYSKIQHMNELKFDAMNIEISQMNAIWTTIHALDLDIEVIKFNQDFSQFINQSNFHPLKVLTMNIEYLPPTSVLLSKFCHSLEEIDILLNMSWINDEKPLNKSIFPEDLIFPNLKKLTLGIYKREPDDFEKISDSKSLAKLLQASARIEELIVTNFSKLQIDFDAFKYLRKITISGRYGYRGETFNLDDLLTQLVTLPEGQLRYFKIAVEMVLRETTPEETLICLLQRQRQRLENLYLSLNSSPQLKLIKLPRCMPNLKKLWISADYDRATGSGSSWGLKLGAQLAKEGVNFIASSEILETLRVVREGAKCNRESCRTCSDSLVYGECRQNNFGNGKHLG